MSITRRTLAGTLLALGCGRTAPVTSGEGPPTTAPSAVAPAVADPQTVAPTVAETPRPVTVIVRDPATLAELQGKGLGLGDVAFDHAASDNEALARDPFYASIVQRLGEDVDAIVAKDDKAGVGLRWVHRVFDVRWLSSSRAWYELVGVVNRLDRRTFTPGTCGETRLVYRLAHRGVQKKQEITSRLPMTVNVVFWQKDDGDGCRTRANAWRRDGLALRDAGGPLADDALALANLHAVEVDVQTERWPATIRPDLAGHAGYALRVFGRDEARRTMIELPLENTPDAPRLAKDAKARAELVAWLRAPDTLAAIDRGTALAPTTLLATKVESVTPRGLARRANRPWSAVLRDEDLAGLDLSTYATIASPAALLRRLDGLSCGGCHQSRSIAGFHMLGDEPDDPDRVDALQVGTSPHLQAELVRRAAYVTAVAEGRTPDEHRPAAEIDQRPGSYASHCGLGDPGFASMQCEAPLKCTRIDDEHVGVCLPEEAGAGAPCEVGLVKTQPASPRDRITKPTLLPCAKDGVCDDNRVGFPGGMCAIACSKIGADEACGGIVGLTPFNNCLSQGRPFADCVRETANPAGMRACDATRACRDDYICARTGKGEGVCMPPYFLYQLRVDGHPG
jgi:hypothetical protein